MYLWIKDGFEEQVEALLIVEKPNRFVGIFTDVLSGRKYIETYSNIGDPTIKIRPDLLALMAEITVHDNAVGHSYQEGIYRFEGVTIMVRTTSWNQSLPCSQSVYISSPISLEKLQRIYALFRQGRLTPVERWQPQSTKFGKLVASLRNAFGL